MSGRSLTDDRRVSGKHWEAVAMRESTPRQPSRVEDTRRMPSRGGVHECWLAALGSVPSPSAWAAGRIVAVA